MTTTSTNAVLAAAPAAPDQAVAWFSARLAMQTDVSDVRAALAAGGDPGFTLVDVRGPDGWAQGHLPGAIHAPHREIDARAADLDPRRPVVTYCWGPGCDGAVRGALAFARLGFRVKEMVGGVEYWVREGFPLRTAVGLVTRAPDPLTAPVATPGCDC
jgi:rhodanese-related sulfurtransferase